MEKEIDIAKILKNATIGTKLYSPLFGDVFLKYIGEMFITVRHHGTTANFYHNGRLYDYEGTELMLFPSKEMRDWSKFAWNKGDILVNSAGFNVFFDRWANDNYTRFFAKTKDLGPSFSYDTYDYTLISKEDASKFVKSIKYLHGGILNLDTLEIEKQPKFKDGDIVFMKGIKLFANCIFILKGEYKDGDERAFYYAFYNADDKFAVAEYGNTKVHYSLRSATDSEKQQLFDALAKGGKAWDAEKKLIVDLPKKCEFKPMDWCLMRDIRGEECFAWSLYLFAYQLESGRYEAVGGMRFDECIPYNEETAHLLGTTDE